MNRKFKYIEEPEYELKLGAKMVMVDKGIGCHCEIQKNGRTEFWMRKKSLTDKVPEQRLMKMWNGGMWKIYAERHVIL